MAECTFLIGIPLQAILSVAVSARRYPASGAGSQTCCSAHRYWYPSQGFGAYATYDMTFRVPKGMTMVATGKLLKKIDEGGETITEWTSGIPQTVAGFNFGNFKREEGKPLKQPYLLETYANPTPPDIIAGLQHIDDRLSLDGSHMPAGAPREQGFRDARAHLSGDGRW
jgi:hypothetical protein